MDGIVNVYKEKGWTSFDVTKKLRGILGEKKVGHTGTLDPMAEGVLVVCAGQATKLVNAITGTDKTYVADMLLGVTTDTEDITGTVLSQRPLALSDSLYTPDQDANADRTGAAKEVQYVCLTEKQGEKKEIVISEDAIREAVASFIGEYDQVPPMYSAKKIDGHKLYDLARQGKTVERKPCHVRIEDIRILDISFPGASEAKASLKNDDVNQEILNADLALRYPHVTMEVTCSKGTYIRTLISDIGKKLGCGACMAALKRTRVGSFKVEESHTIADLQALKDEDKLVTAVRPAIYIPEDTVATFGKFDGGHLGHQLIFENVKRIARETGRKTAVLTFSGNPQNLVLHENRPTISTEQEHISRLRNQGFDYVFSYPVTRETMQVPAEDFLRGVLIEAMHARDIVVGTDCSFGYKAQGNADMLRSLQEKYGYIAHVITKRVVQDEEGHDREISSTYIKEEIAKGNVKRAGELLGRYFTLSGAVQHGKHIGSGVLHFPTANIFPSAGKTIPKEGVYVTRVLVDEKLYKGMTNVGTNPTTGEDNPVSIETYILGYEGDLYGKKIRVEFLDRIRDQQKFPTLSALHAQLERDMQYVKKYCIPDVTS